MTKKLIILLIIGILLGFGVEASVACISVNDDLKMEISCAEYQGVRYKFMLVAYPNPDDPTGLYWQMDTSTFATQEGSSDTCISAGNDLKLPISCAEYQGKQYSFDLNFYPNPTEPFGIYWKMDIGTFRENYSNAVCLTVTSSFACVKNISDSCSSFCYDVFRRSLEQGGLTSYNYHNFVTQFRGGETTFSGDLTITPLEGTCKNQEVKYTFNDLTMSSSGYKSGGFDVQVNGSTYSYPQNQCR